MQQSHRPLDSVPSNKKMRVKREQGMKKNAGGAADMLRRIHVVAAGTVQIRLSWLKQVMIETIKDGE